MFVKHFRWKAQYPFGEGWQRQVHSFFVVYVLLLKCKAFVKYHYCCWKKEWDELTYPLVKILEILRFIPWHGIALSFGSICLLSILLQCCFPCKFSDQSNRSPPPYRTNTQFYKITGMKNIWRIKILIMASISRWIFPSIIIGTTEVVWTNYFNLLSSTFSSLTTFEVFHGRFWLDHCVSSISNKRFTARKPMVRFVCYWTI